MKIRTTPFLKKIICVICLICLLVTFISCAEQAPTSFNSDSSQGSSTIPSNVESDTKVPEPTSIQVGMTKEEAKKFVTDENFLELDHHAWFFTNEEGNLVTVIWNPIMDTVYAIHICPPPEHPIEDPELAIKEISKEIRGVSLFEIVEIFGLPYAEQTVNTTYFHFKAGLKEGYFSIRVSRPMFLKGDYLYYAYNLSYKNP